MRSLDGSQSPKPDYYTFVSYFRVLRKWGYASGGHISNRSIRRKNMSNLALLPSFRAPKRRKLWIMWLKWITVRKSVALVSLLMVVTKSSRRNVPPFWLQKWIELGHVSQDANFWLSSHNLDEVAVIQKCQYFQNYKLESFFLYGTAMLDDMPKSPLIGPGFHNQKLPH